MVVAFVALVAALSGTAVALPGKNKVDSGDIKNGQVKSADIKNNDVRSGDVKNGSLLAKDFKSGELPNGPKGDKGDKGDTGATGPPGSALGYARVRADGTLDAARSKNMAIIEKPTDGTYCLIVPPGTRNIAGTVEAVALGTSPSSAAIVFTASLEQAYVDISFCDAPSNAVVVLRNVSASRVDADFYATIN